MQVSIEIVRDDGSLLTLTEAEKIHIMKALELTMNWTKAARLLGIGRSTLYRKLEQHDLLNYVKELRELLRKARAEEKEKLRIALQLTAQPDRLCEMLDVEYGTLQKMLQRHGFSLKQARTEKLARIREERIRHERDGTLLVAA